MRVARIAFAVTLLALGASRPARAQTAARDVAAVRALDSLWAHNYAVNDTAKALQLMAPDFFMTASNGSTKDRAAELRDIRPTAGLTLHYFRSESPNIHVYGPSAVVSGFASWSFDQGGRATTVRRKYTAVYIRGGPLGWQLQELHMAAAG